MQLFQRQKNNRLPAKTGRVANIELATFGWLFRGEHQVTIAMIEAALEERLLAITPAIATAFENKTYTPVTGTEYQRINHLTNTPVDHAVTLDVTEDRGILQVSLFYTLDKGRVPAKTRAQLICDQFKPPLTLTKGAVKVEITKTPSIGSGYPDGDRYMVPVSIYWRSFQTP